jgi:hypothetical protein
MTHSAVGELNTETRTNEHALLSSDWYKDLSPEQLTAYVRFQFIYLKDRVSDWDAPAHSRRRPAWDGGKDSYGVKHSSAWAKAIRAITAAGANPGVWIYAQFAPKVTDATARITDPRPAMLYSTNAMSAYENFCVNMPAILQQRYMLAAETIKMRLASTKAYGLNKDDQTLYVLGDESYVTATPFFRHAFAALAGCERAIERYLWFAALEYEALQPLYDRTISKKPELAWWTGHDMPDAVCAIRQHWKGYNA